MVGAVVAGAFVAATALPALTFSAPRAEADLSDGSLGVNVIRDVNGNGAYEPALEVGVAGATVTVLDSSGATTSGTTGADGTVAVDLSLLSGGKYRVQVDPPADSVLQPAPAGSGLSSTTSFVDVSDGTNVALTVGLWNPADYCQENPTLVTACQRNALTPGVDPAARSLVSFPFTARGTGASPTQLASQGETGTVYGIAYRKQDKRVFSGAFAKRAAAYGPGGPGAIYVTDTATNTTTLYATVPNAGTTAHAMDANFDAAFANVVGKESLGDVDISEDGSTLYVVNIADRRLYLYDATTATADAPTASYGIPSPGCPAAGDWHPGALGVRDGVVRVGGICSGESTQNQADMRVVVRTFDPATGAFGAPVVDQVLTFERGTSLWNGSGTNHWLPWQTTFQQPAPFGGLVTRPEPLLTDIGIESNGDLVLAFRDRFGDQGGKSMPPSDGSGGLFDTVSGGDLNRVCRQADGSYAWEGTSDCPSNNTAANNGGGQSTSFAEYYPGEYYSDADGAPHNETAQGALAMVYGADRMPTIVMDPTAINTGGVGWFDRGDGTMANSAHSNAYLISDVATEGWGKANGLGDLEALCDQAPVQIGDRVWYDADANGVQGPAEPAISGVTVQLLSCDGSAVLATRTTDAQGLYYFGTADGLEPDTCYTLQFDYSAVDPATLPGSPPTSSLRWTTADVGDDRRIDSNVDATGKATVTVGTPGSVDHTIDAGVVAAQNRLGDLVWVDANRNGVQDADEPGIAEVPVTLRDGSGNVLASTTTGADGTYLFDRLADGAYSVCFDLKTLPAQYAGYLPTRVDAGGDDVKDSDADVTTGCTPLTTLGPAKREDLTVDAGIRPPNTIGDFVWIDANKNGLQDDGEQPVPGVAVELSNGATTTTDDQGKYLFTGLPDGEYEVCFDLTALPAAVADYQATTPNAGDDAKDSDADPATGCAPKTTLNIDNPEDMTIDLGLIAPVNRLGDYVWIDANKNGLQDDGEQPVPGVAVELSNGATTTTDDQGKYLFTGLPDGTYTVCFDLANLPTEVNDYVVTTKDAGDDAKDSDADPATGCAPPAELGPGKRENLSLDMGLVSPPNSLGDYVWLDANKNGVQDDGEPGVPNMPVTLSAGQTTTTDANGRYLFTDLPDGTYSVCFGPMPAAVQDYQFTTPNAGDDAKDSDADVATGCTPAVGLGVGKRENLTLDAGIIEPVNRLGDYVWIDTNKNGLQDDGEPPVPGVTVKLSNGATTTTDDQGKYLFTELPDGTHTVCFDIKALPAAVADYTVTAANAGDDGKDSDADPATGCAPPAELGVGKRENLTLDVGLVAPPNKLGDLVWSDTNRDGLQDPGEPGVPGVSVKLVGSAGTPVGEPVKTGPDGRYEFANIPDGMYTVCFDMSALPGDYAGYLATKPNAGDDAKDSDVDVASGCTPPVTVGVGKRENLTVDLGLVPPTNRVGDFVWFDDNANGVQDPNERGVPDVPVLLQDGNGVLVTTTKTGEDGKYLFTDLPDGEYKVCFGTGPQTGLVAGRRLTKPNAGDDGTDSDADPATTCTSVVTLGKDKRVDLTLDAGLLPPTQSSPLPSAGVSGPLAWTGVSGWGLLGTGLLLLAGGTCLVLTGRRCRV